MTTTKAYSVSIAVSVVVGFLAFYVAMGELAKTNDRYDNSTFLFPYAFLVFYLSSSEVLLLPLMFVQFPAYGVFYGWAWSKKREWWAGTWLFVTHLLLGYSALLLWKIERSVSRGYYPF